jgi:tRNA threonylcarbamoyladenosine biosynthesis protein TsaB
MTILALDTASNSASVAIRRDGETTALVELHSAGGFAHLLFPAIEKCVNEATIRPRDIDCFAAAAGPGSFTGVRVALSAVKGLSEAYGKPAIAVSNLRALSSFGKNALRAVLLDARRGELYTAVYDAQLRPVLPEAVLPLTEFLAQLDRGVSYEFLSTAPLAVPDLHVVTAPLAPAVALCAERAGSGNWSDPALLDANYVRRSDAELFWQDR